MKKDWHTTDANQGIQKVLNQLILICYLEISRWMSYEDSKKWVFPSFNAPDLDSVYVNRQKIGITDQNILNF